MYRHTSFCSQIETKFHERFYKFVSKEITPMCGVSESEPSAIAAA